MPICHRSRRRLSLWGSLDLFGSSNAVPLVCSEQDGLNHPDAGRSGWEGLRPCGIGCRLPVAGTTNYKANYADPEHSVNMSEINNCHNVTSPRNRSDRSGSVREVLVPSIAKKN